MLAIAPAAFAQAPGYNNVTGNPVEGNSPPPADGGMANVGGDVPTDMTPGPAPPQPSPARPMPSTMMMPASPRRVTTCRRRGRARVCRTRLGGVLLRNCTTRGRGAGRRKTCRSYDPRGRVTAVCTTRGRGKMRCRRVRMSLAAAAGKAPAARMSVRLGSGFSNPVLRPVVRFYHPRSGGATKGWCSGTLIRRGLVLTAAHCLYGNRHDGEGFVGYFPIDGFRVVPANTPNGSGGDAAPYGTWRVRDTFVPDGWRNEDGGLDWGIAVIQPDANGNYPGDFTGTYSVTWNARFNPGTRLYRIGYPASGPYNMSNLFYGGGQYFCDMTWDGMNWANDPYIASSYALVTNPCEMNGGSSGGPAMVYFSNIGWSIVGVNNRGLNRSDGFGEYGLSFYFDNRFGQFWNSVLSQLG